MLKNITPFLQGISFRCDIKIGCAIWDYGSSSCNYLSTIFRTV